MNTLIHLLYQYINVKIILYYCSIPFSKYVPLKNNED